MCGTGHTNRSTNRSHQPTTPTSALTTHMTPSVAETQAELPDSFRGLCSTFLEEHTLKGYYRVEDFSVLLLPDVHLLPYDRGWQCRKFEGNLAEASASRSCGGGPGGLLFICLFVCLFVYLFIFKFSRGSCLGYLNAIYGPGLVWHIWTVPKGRLRGGVPSLTGRYTKG